MNAQLSCEIRHLSFSALGLAGVLMANAAMAGPSSLPNRLDASSRTEVLTGLDVLEREQFSRLHGLNVGLIGNHSSINRHGRHLLDLLMEAPEVNLVALFSPEHGFRGTADERVADGVDEQTGLPVFSLYGATRVPTDESLRGLDAVVFDIQDIGARFYTYISTMGEFMIRAREHGIRFFVLDRPNPIQGNWFDGSIQDADLVGRFTSFRPMPIAHGMTVGEIALFFQKFFDISPELEVVKMEGWKREMYFDETGLPWVNPSPNMRSVDEELLYTLVGLAEGNKDISVGRGTDRPFEYIGAPWVDGRALAENLNNRRLPGVWFMETTFVPSAIDVTGRPNVRYPFTGEVCHGVRVVITDRHAISPVASGIHLLDALLEIHPERFRVDQLRGLLGAQWVLDALRAREDPDAIVRRWRESEEFKEFAERRAAVLLY